jgi:C_GCAxxG_C_C family probable redox protein
VLAVGEHLWGHVEDLMLRISCGLAGGVGCSHQELCGALSGGVLVLGALYGRTHPDEDDAQCDRLICTYRERFVQEFGTSRCCELKASGYGSDGQWPCSTLVERATRILLHVLATEAQS